MFHAIRHGDFGPLVFAGVVFVFGLVLLLNLRGATRYMAEQVVERYPIYQRFGGVTFGYRIGRLSGLVGLVMAIAIIVFA